MLGEHKSREVQEAMDHVIRDSKVEDPEWFWETIGRAGYGYHTRAAGARGEMDGQARILSEWYLALSLGGGRPEELAKGERDYRQQLLNCRNEDGSFRHPGRERFLFPEKYFASLPASAAKAPRYFGEFSRDVYDAKKGNPYPTAGWCSKVLGYGEDWTEVMITARAVYALGIPKRLLPGLNPWRNRRGADDLGPVRLDRASDANTAEPPAGLPRGGVQQGDEKEVPPR
jgi:hypothetical protein